MESISVNSTSNYSSPAIGSNPSSSRLQVPSTQDLSNQLDSNHDQLNSVLQINSQSSNTNTISSPDFILKIVQDNNYRTLNFLEKSFRTLLSDVIESIQNQVALDHCSRQILEINKQFLLNAVNLNDEVRTRVDSILHQQKLELELEKKTILAKSHPSLPSSLSRQPSSQTDLHSNSPKSTHTPQRKVTSSQPVRPSATGIEVSPVAVDSSDLHPTLLNATTTPARSFGPLIQGSSYASPSTPPLFSPNNVTGISNLFPKLSSLKRSRSMVEYDDSLMDEMNLPGPDLSMSANATPESADISVIDNGSSAASHQISSGRALDDKTKPFPKSSYRQSSILRNLVSSSLGKLIAQVTQNQQQHWPGSDTQARLAAIGLSIELAQGSKLTTEVIYKGPKNLQLQQCKRILLELELGILRLKEVKAVPRPSRRRKRDTEGDSQLITNQDLVEKYIHSNAIPISATTEKAHMLEEGGVKVVVGVEERRSSSIGEEEKSG
ncbi:hypothetical protein CROQUDRAFT_652503 [Cronartium quercuum f. sp. fusiforme G11]|uniref:Uncharacterized protein n=1 Tax=Cronartium quercuum f. sp. fusiforme G11 TaxID=708437 RepID=A0A9P6NRG8_9BASI|nr:hypothetical protein CROQUDRAFT_652503 [Cronartium quercuum f. sp. fusiforme G11]